jgi:DNA polymerase-3 subunit alpha
VAGARQKGLTENEAEAIWQFFPPFAFYGFNQAHAIIYGYLTYITAYLKVHYAPEYLGALLSVATDTEGVVKAVGECRRLGVPLLGPDVNHSIPGIGLEKLPDSKLGLRLGLATIKGLGPTGLEAIISARREGGPFSGLGDFIRRVPGRAVNARTLTALAKVGAFPFGNRAQIEEGIAAAQKAAKGKMFFEPDLPTREEYSLETLLTNEFEMLGFHITAVPVTETIERLAQESKFDTYTNELATRPEDKPVKMAGAVLGGRQVQARYGTMFVFDLDDGRGLVEVTVLPKLYKEQAALLKEGKILLIDGKIDKREGRARLQALKVTSAE